MRFPQKSDYPNSLKAIDRARRTKKYHQLIEASASAYFETKGLTKWLFLNRFKLAFKYLEPVDSLLDAGTGIGFFLPTLSRVAKKVEAIDCTEYSLKYAREMCKNLNIKNVSFKKASLERLPFKDNQFDVVICLSVLEHIPANKLPTVVDNFYKVLKPGGILIAGYPNEGSYFLKLLQTAERLLIRRKIFKAFKEDRSKYKTLGHVSTAKQINRAIKDRFKTINQKSLPLKWITLYCLGKFKQ